MNGVPFCTLLNIDQSGPPFALSWILMIGLPLSSLTNKFPPLHFGEFWWMGFSLCSLVIYIFLLSTIYLPAHLASAPICFMSFILELITMCPSTFYFLITVVRSVERSKYYSRLIGLCLGLLVCWASYNYLGSCSCVEIAKIMLGIPCWRCPCFEPSQIYVWNCSCVEPSQTYASSCSCVEPSYVW